MKKTTRYRTKTTKQSNLILWSFFVLFIWLAVAAPWFNVGIANYSFVKSYVAASASSILFLILLWNNRRQTFANWQFNPLTISLLALFVLATSSVLWSVNIDFFVSKWLLLLVAVFSFIAATNITINHANLITISWAVVLGGLIIGAIGVAQFLFDPFDLPQAITPSSTFGNRNMATQPLVLLLPLTLFLLFSPKIKGGKVWLVSISVVAILSFVFYTGSRNAWLAIGVEFVLAIAYLLLAKSQAKQWIHWDKNKRNAVIFAALATFIFINFSADGLVGAGTKINKNITRSSETISKVTSGSDSRIGMWRITTKMIQDAPLLGTGLGSWSHNERQGGYGTVRVYIFQRAHNDLLELTSELGLLGLALFFAVVWQAIRVTIAISKRSSADIGGFFWLLLLGLTGSFINMQFSFPYQMAVPLFLAGWFLGLLAKQFDQISTAPSKQLPFGVLTRRVFFVVSLLFCGGVATVYLQWAGAYADINKGHSKRNFADIANYVDTWFYHWDMQTILNALSKHYQKRNKLQQSLLIDEQILSYGTNASAIERSSKTQLKLGRIDDALANATKLRRINGFNNHGYMLQVSIHEQAKQTAKLHQDLDDILHQPEQLATLGLPSYRKLLLIALRTPQLADLLPDLYDQYIKHYGRASCKVENNIAVFYYRNNNMKKAASHVDYALGRPCAAENLKPKVAKILRQTKQLIDSASLQMPPAKP